MRNEKENLMKPFSALEAQNDKHSYKAKRINNDTFAHLGDKIEIYEASYWKQIW